MDEAKAQRETQVCHELNEIGFAAERLEKTINCLIERLKSVLQERSAEVGMVQKEPDSKQLVPLAQQIKGRSCAINRLNDKLGDVIAGLEI
ncbi:hypothetical protein LCGC14_1125990 [marine sediment metagenome]|uniref:Uncharacterized protein n=2 Tax=root TaxID=1 RepID=A0A831QN14_9FLAO|nr:hypothetical protein [Methylophaga sp.]HEA19642.1 hypothetical protein [Pricia antarctica]